MSQKLLERENSYLAELGNDQGKQRYFWTRAENCTLPRAARDADGKVILDYIADPDSGLIKAQTKIESTSMVPHLRPSQWVLCRFLPPPTQREWDATVGSQVPYPAQGYYAPTDVDLEDGIDPWMITRGHTLTEWIVATGKAQQAKSFREHYEDGVKAVEYREKEVDRQLDDQLGDLLLPFANAPHVPGKRGGAVSVPATAQDAG